ncbi:hypothetical protein M0804_009692 [Polistes exclamans]|nr:hypothetical protein M0804_009692 [Polistes exclamans]
MYTASIPNTEAGIHEEIGRWAMDWSINIKQSPEERKFRFLASCPVSLIAQFFSRILQMRALPVWRFFL